MYFPKQLMTGRDPQYKRPRPTALLGPTVQTAETHSITGTHSTNGQDSQYKFWYRVWKDLDSDFCFCINEEEENWDAGSSLRNAHFLGGGPFLRGQEGPNGHSSAPTATVTLWASATFENQVRLTHFVRL